jgi:tRNA G18 (ribose-2'-O)-methylase SpoU
MPLEVHFVQPQIRGRLCQAVFAESGGPALQNALQRDPAVVGAHHNPGHNGYVDSPLVVPSNPSLAGIFKKPDVDSFRPPEALPFTVICDNIREPGNLGTILRICAAVGCDRVILTKGCVNLWDSKVLRGAVGAHFKLRISKDFEWDQIEEAIAEDANFFIADNKIVSDSDEGGRDLAEVLEQIPVFPYHGLDFNASKHVVLIVGGETHGISRSSYELALKSNGARVNIPLSNDVDSLNVGAALGVIAFEVKKQLVDRSTCG